MKRLMMLTVLMCCLCSLARAEVTLVVSAYSFGPSVSALLVDAERPLTDDEISQLTVTTAGIGREVVNCAYDDETHRLHINLTDKNAMQCPLFVNETGTGRRVWTETYPVTINGAINVEEDAIDRRISPEADRFGIRMECGDIHLAAYEPESLAGGGKNPLIIWLHGGGEGGDNIDAALLGNEVSQLAKVQIQQHFTSADGSIGAYVLIPQCPTMWMDEGDGVNAEGLGVSVYTEALMNAIDLYLASNEDVDTDRIYLGGCSNGGYMTLNMCTVYPGVFAAAFAVCEAYDTTEDYDRIDALVDQPIWFVQSIDDMVVDPQRYVIPTYADLIYEDTADCWLSMFDGYNHAVWNAVFHDLVDGVQDPVLVSEEMVTEPNRTKGGSYTADGVSNLFDWLNLHAIE